MTNTNTTNTNTETLFTERQSVETLQAIVESLANDDRRRMEADLKFVMKQCEGDPHKSLLITNYRFGFALSTIWTRANLTAPPRRERDTEFVSRLYEPEKSACRNNLPENRITDPDPHAVYTAYFGALSPPRDYRQTSFDIAKAESRHRGYCLGWRDGTDYIRSSHGMPLEESTAARHAMYQSTIKAANARELYRRESEALAMRYYDECIANGIEPRPVNFI